MNDESYVNNGFEKREKLEKNMGFKKVPIRLGNRNIKIDYSLFNSTDSQGIVTNKSGRWLPSDRHYLCHVKWLF